MSQHIDRYHDNSPSLDHCVALYLDSVAAEVALGQRPQSTIATYRSQARLITPELRARPITAIRRADVRSWHIELGKRRGKQGQLLTGAADHALKVLRSVYRFADFEELAHLPVYPTRGLKPLHRSRGARALAEAELMAWREALDVHEHYRGRRVRGLRNGHPKLVAAYVPTMVLRLLDLMGARITEVRGLRVEHLHLGLQLVMFDETKTDEGHARPLSDAAVRCLHQHLARLGNPTSGWLFPGRDPSRCVSDTHITRVFQAICKVAGISGAVRRSLRTTLVTHGFRRRQTSAAMAFERYRQALPGESWDVVEAHAQRRKGRAA